MCISRPTIETSQSMTDRLSTLRVRKIGSNENSDKYLYATQVEAPWKDLALFIAHTGFANVRVSSKSSELDILPLLHSLEDIHRFWWHRRGMGPSTEITCGIIFTSLDMAWHIIDQGTLQNGNELWYTMDEFRFILYVRNGISRTTYRILSDDDDTMSSGNASETSFRPIPMSLSIDAFIRTQIVTFIHTTASATHNDDADGGHCVGTDRQLVRSLVIRYGHDHVRTSLMHTMTSFHIYHAVCMMFPQYMKDHGMSRSHITNRLGKLKMDLLGLLNRWKSP